MTPIAGDRELDALLAAAAAPYERGEQGEQDLDLVLAAFNAAAYGMDDGGDAVAYGRIERAYAGSAFGRRLAVKWAVAVVLVAGCAVGLASARVLPAPIQQFAHHALGGIGVRAPDTVRTALGGGPTGSASAPGASGSGSSSSGAPTAELAGLCETVTTDADDWRIVLSAADQAILVAAAGDEQKIVAYCAHMVAASSKNTAAASPAATAPASASASDSDSDSDSASASASASAFASASATDSADADAEATRGGGHATRTPSAKTRSTAH
jgi:hypothetical protein